MQLHRLRLSAIGPFAEPVEVDFDRLSASGIFLLEGPTGAGKSTLIDAIVFALYGEVAGRTSSGDRIASAVAADGVTPSVELDFSTSHGVFRIRRTPKHARRKRRGSGTTVENASGSLWRMVGPESESPGEPIATRLDEIGAEVLDIVGLSREQFVQTVVLPQGEFATFLRADAEHRRALLQKLFGTEIYERTVARLVDQRRTAQQQRSAAATAVLGSVSAYCGAMGLGPADEDELVAMLERHPDDCLAGIQSQLDATAAVAATARKQLAECAERAGRARGDHAEASRREQARQRVVELQAQLAALDAGSEQLASDIATLAAARAASHLVQQVEGLGKARERAADAQRGLAALTCALPDPDLPVGGWTTRQQRCLSEAAALEPLLDVERGFVRARAQLDEQRADLAGLRRRRDQLLQQVAAGPEQIQSTSARLHEAVATAATSSDARTQLDSAKRLVRAAAELASLDHELGQAKTERAESSRVAKHLVAREAQLRVKFLDGMAGHLAAQLEGGEPCPVCGSCEHPRPAQGSEPVARDDLDHAAEQAAVALRHVDAVQQQVSALEAAAAKLLGELGGQSLAQLQQSLATAENRVAAAEDAESAAVQLRQELADAERRLGERRAELQSVEKAVASAEAGVSAAERQLRSGEQQVAAALAGHPTLSLRAEALEHEARAWGRAPEAHSQLVAAERDVAVRATEVDEGIGASPFATVDAALAAHLEPDSLERLQVSIEQRQAARAAYEGELQSPELIGVDVHESINVAALDGEVKAADRAVAEAQSADAQIRQRLGEGQARAAEVQSGLAAQRSVLGATTATIRMADLVSATSADNAKAMSLPTFVLRERFVEVVASANERLATMSDGRYRLEHVEAKRGNRKSGLDLQVRDAHIEQPRDPATLSGGEAFYCSLALALGLADVVTAEAGGIDIGTLFVDEGFGSLDPDTLDQVLAVLHGLSSSGRVVGIVSHVPELKEQVTERISVVPNRDGSSRLVVAA